MSEDSMTESQRNQLAAELTGPGAFERPASATIERLSGLVVELVRERSRATTVRPPKIEVRDMKAELSAEPVSYADEFDTAEDMAKLRRERDEACEGFERLRDLLEATRKTLCAPFDMSAAQAAGRRMKELADLRSQLEAAEKKAQAFPGAELEGLRCQVLDYRQRLGAVESALDAEAVIQDYTERVKDEAAAAAQVEYRARLDGLRDELDAVSRSAESNYQDLSQERDEARAQAEAALAGAEAARKDLADLCMLISDGEHSSFVLASQRVQEMKAETKAAQEELTHLKTERTTLVKELGRAQDRAKFAESEWAKAASQRDVLRQQIEGNEAPTQGEES